MDEAAELFKKGQAILATATDHVEAMKGRSLCRRAIEMRWYEHSQGNLLDPPWVERQPGKVVGNRISPKEDEQLALFDMPPSPTKKQRRGLRRAATPGKRPPRQPQGPPLPFVADSSCSPQWCPVWCRSYRR